MGGKHYSIKGETSIKEFLALVDESNRCQFLEGLNNKTNLTIYKNLGGEVKRIEHLTAKQPAPRLH